MSRKPLTTAMIKAIGMINISALPDSKTAAERDDKLIYLRQLFRLAQDNFRVADSAAYQAWRAKNRAQGLLEELRVKIEIREEELGVEKKECEHADVDDHKQCLDGGADRTEAMQTDHEWEGA